MLAHPARRAPSSRGTRGEAAASTCVIVLSFEWLTVRTEVLPVRSVDAGLLEERDDAALDDGPDPGGCAEGQFGGRDSSWSGEDDAGLGREQVSSEDVPRLRVEQQAGVDPAGSEVGQVQRGSPAAGSWTTARVVASRIVPPATTRASRSARHTDQGPLRVM